MGGEGEPIIMIMPEQIVIAAVTLHLLLIKRLDDQAKLPIRGSDLATGIDIIVNQDMIILPGQGAPINTGITLAAPLGTFVRITP
jgi:dUTPase